MKRIIATAVIAAILMLSLVSVSAEVDTVAGLDVSYTVKDNGNILINASIVDITDPTGISGLIYYVKFNTRLMEYVSSDVPIPSAWESLVAYDAVDALFFSEDNDYCWMEFVSYSGYAIKGDDQLRLQFELEPIVTNIDLQIEFACEALYNDSPDMEPLKGASKTLTIKKSDLKPVVDSSSEVVESSEAVSSEIDITSDIPLSEPSFEPSFDEPSVESDETEIPLESSADIEIPNISMGELIPSEEESSIEEITSSEEAVSSEEDVSSVEESDDDISAEISSDIENDSYSLENESSVISESSETASSETDILSQDTESSVVDKNDNSDDEEDEDDNDKDKKSNGMVSIIVSVVAVIIIGVTVTVVMLLRKNKVK